MHCAAQALNTLASITPGNFTVTIPDPSCGNLILNNSISDGPKDYTCPMGHILKSGFCCKLFKSIYNYEV